MAASLTRTARTSGVPAAGMRLLAAAHARAMEPRVAVFDDDHHPAYLHPGRTALILLRDVGVAEGALLAAATLVESRDARLRVPLAEVERVAGPEVRAHVASVPLAGAAGLAERLVTLPGDALLVALAEHLDHLRHAHLDPEKRGWPELHAEASAVWGPLAERAHPVLARRYAHWIRTFAKRL